MANIKFSQFTVETAKADVDFLVGYSGPDNVQISPTNLLADYPAGSGAAGQVTFFSAASTVTGDNDFYWDNINKRLGIGTTSPDYNLHVKKASTNTSITIEGSTNAGANFSSKLNFSNKGISGNDIDFTIGLKKTNNLVFMGDAAANELMRIEGNTGDVGIGTATPSAKLHVDGTLIATGVSQLGSGGSNVLLTSSSAGDVGIGDSSPTAKLVVNNVGTKMLELKRSGNIKFRVLADANHGQLNMFNSGSSNTVRLHTSGDSYFNGGNVGIGITSPTTKLHIDESGTTSPALFIDTARYGAYIIGDGTSNSQYLLNLQSNGGSTEVMRVQSSGNVGIGTTSPQEKLDISGGSIRLDDNQKITWSTNDSNIGRVRITGNESNDFLTFVTDNSEKMRINSLGNVGIGTTSPVSKLDVAGNIQATGTRFINCLFDSNHYMRLESNSSGGLLKGADGGVITTLVRSYGDSYFNGGNFGIGTSSPASKLEVDGGDIEVDDSASGLILRSPDGTRYRVTVANGGTNNLKLKQWDTDTRVITQDTR
jgi:hypothetical protein